MQHYIVAPEVVGRMSRAAMSLLGVLGDEERRAATFEFADQERLNWHFVPRPRKGFPRKRMSDRQVAAADALMETGLSPSGYRKAKAIIDLEVILREAETMANELIHDRDPGLYYYSIFGDPAGPMPWGWRLEGHHVSLNYTVSGDRLSITPAFFGANPAEVRHGDHKGMRILRDEEEIARGLARSLSSDQAGRAIIAGKAPRDIATRDRAKVDMGAPVGLQVGAMTAGQAEAALRLVRLYIERHPAVAGELVWAAVEAASTGDVHFAWAGGLELGQGH